MFHYSGGCVSLVLKGEPQGSRVTPHLSACFPELSGNMWQLRLKQVVA